jgi:transposase InsO family protein
MWLGSWSTRWCWRGVATGTWRALTGSPRAGSPSRWPATEPAAATTVANKSSTELEDRIVRLREELTDQGFDAGAQTIHYHLGLSDPSPPSVSTIWRILKRRGFVEPQPHKRPRSSYIRFEASLPNETWQSDVTFFELQRRHHMPRLFSN